MFKRVCSFVLVLAMLLAMLPADEVQGFFRRAFADDTIPEPIFQLPESEIAEEHVSGGWRYALREDGFAVITGYEGVFTEGTVPYALDGYYVVELAENALPDAQRVELHVNIMDIADSAFGESLQEITSPNGSFGLYWAAQHIL